MTKRIGIFTSTRADYGLLFHLMKNLNADHSVDLHLMVTGTHLSKNHDLSVNLIDRTIFKNIHEFPVDVEKSEAEIFAETLTRGAVLLDSVLLDVCVILGDRFEALAFAVACFMKNVPIAHLHGGELTFGAKDDAYRHSITKLAKLHLTAHEEYTRRVIQLGEQPESVFTTGPFGLDYLNHIQKKSKVDLENELGFQFKTHNLLITLHPETHSPKEVLTAIDSLLSGLDAVPNCGFIFTMPNIDQGGLLIRERIKTYCEKNIIRAKAFENLGSTNYLSLLSYVDAVVGNSSSGIYEAPYLKVPTINIGHRQEGRIKASSVIDVDFNPTEITRSILHVFSNKKSIIEKLVYPFSNLEPSSKAKAIILDYDFSLLKRFYDSSK